MKQKDKKNKISGEEGFVSFYGELFGERWPKLMEALKMPSCPKEFRAGGLESYYLDAASVRAATSLPLKGAESVLDMCAAPGGKSLVLAVRMDKDAELLCNERSSDRRIRLIKTVKNCLPPEIERRVRISGKDGGVLCKFPENRFDRILLDAPCSSERHVLNDPAYLKDWSFARIKTLALAQWSLLSSGWRMLNSGGYLLYSTCALNKNENDEIVGRLLKKFDDVIVSDVDFSVFPPEFMGDCLPEGEKTKYGFHILPDKCGGAGPLYFSLLQKA